MKLILFAICIACCQARSESNQQLDIPKLFRNVRTGFVLSEGDRCVQNCTEDAYKMQEMKSIHQQMIANINASTFIEKLMQPEITSKLCRLINKTDNCYENCPLSMFYQSALRPIIKSAEYACNQPKFMNAIPCYSRIFQETYQTCNAIDKCAAKKQMFELNRPSGEYKTNMFTFCDYASCLKDCRHQKIVQECGQEESNVLNVVFQKIFNGWDTSIRAHADHDSLPTSCAPFREILN